MYNINFIAYFVADSNVYQLLPLAEEYQITEVKKKCEEFLLTKEGSMELLLIAQKYNLMTLLQKCIEFARKKSYNDLRSDPRFESLEMQNLISILELRVQDLEGSLVQTKKVASERESRLFGCVSELISNYGSFCSSCKSRKVNDDCMQCLKMYREKVKAKCEEAKTMRNHHQPHFTT